MLAIRIGFLCRPSCAQVSLLDQFFQRADAAGQGDERVGALEHDLLAGVHVGRDDQLVRLGHGVLARHQELGDDAGDLAAVFEHGLGDGAHQPDGAAAIDEPDVVVGEEFAEGFGRFDEAGICAGA